MNHQLALAAEPPMPLQVQCQELLFADQVSGAWVVGNEQRNAARYIHKHDCKQRRLSNRKIPKMPFDHGTITFRACYLPKPLPEDALQRFAGKKAGPLGSVKDDVQWGWVSGRHLLETRIDEETAYLGGYLHLCLRKAQRKIPPSLLRAECRLLELAKMAEKKSDMLSRKEKKEIKEEVSERLLPDMPPQLSGIPFVVDNADNKLYIGSASDSQIDAFLGYFADTIGFEPVPMAPEVAAVDLLKIDPDALPTVSYSSELPDAAANGSLGQNFLMWLWFYQEEHGGILPKTQLGEFSFMLDGPLVFVADGPGALESSIRKGLPMLSAEAKAALQVGKKLKQAKLILAREQDEIWMCTLDADTFSFRGLKLPDGEAMDPNSIFEERVTNLYIFQTVFYALFEKYMRDMVDNSKNSAFAKQVKKWAQERTGK